MGWLVALAILALAVFSRGFRAFLVVVVALVVAIGGIWYLVDQQQKAAARHRVAPSEVLLEGATLGNEQYGGGYRFRARVRNRNSSHLVRMIDVVVTLRDCSAENSCETVGQATDTVYTNVPPGQVRDVEESVYFSPTPVIRGRMSWSFQLTGITAD